MLTMTVVMYEVDDAYQYLDVILFGLISHSSIKLSTITMDLAVISSSHWTCLF